MKLHGSIRRLVSMLCDGRGGGGGDSPTKKQYFRKAERRSRLDQIRHQSFFCFLTLDTPK